MDSRIVTAARRHRLTLLGALLLAVSYCVFALGSAGVVPTAGVWRILVIPAYLTVLVAAMLATLFSVYSGIFTVVGVAAWLVPFAFGDFIVRRVIRTSRAA